MLEILKNAGFDEKTAQSVVDLFPELIKNRYVPVSRINEMREEINGLNGQISERDKQLKTLSGKAEGNEELQKQIKELQEGNKKAKEEFEQKMSALKFDSALDKALMKAKAIDSDLVRVKLDTSSLTLQEDGTIAGLSEQLEGVQKDFGFLFETANPKETIIDGIKPAEPGTTPPNDPFLAGFAE